MLCRCVYVVDGPPQASNNRCATFVLVDYQALSIFTEETLTLAAEAVTVVVATNNRREICDFDISVDYTRIKNSET